MREKRVYFFSDKRKPVLNVTEKIETRVFANNDEKMKRLGNPLIDLRCFLDHALQRI